MCLIIVLYRADSFSTLIIIEITFGDLIEKHEQTHGTLWKYDKEKDGEKWVSSDSEKRLYRKITLRIEEQLEILTEQVVCRDSQ